MENGIIIGKLKKEEVDFYSDMISAVFDEFVGIRYSEQGKTTFKDFITSRNISKRLTDKNNQFITAKCNDEIIGILETKNNSHISLFFVRKEYHGKGIGKLLFGVFLESIRDNYNVIKKITVNSSIFAEKFYAKLGFEKINGMREKDGIIFIPMEYSLGSFPE